ncbi:hypothetical protein LUZ63_008254 [Rhynchospora breviuscula]|uniref:Uncharacterized protein n=1 Tax=Rhynchospora breviuscula TaxID=2022672 RepID=A0A9Q0CU28_9POAL|nr:hypothetical protein LUZ63_008254 [Rhynchospora breviuscula]
MACINMFNPDHQSSLCPRISFSNDFSVEPPSQPPLSQRLPVTDPDFEFSVSGHHMIAADQIFSKGRILPLKESSHYGSQRMTKLREELRESESKVPTLRWKEFLGIKKGHKRGVSTGTVETELHTENAIQEQ